MKMASAIESSVLMKPKHLLNGYKTNRQNHLTLLLLIHLILIKAKHIILSVRTELQSNRFIGKNFVQQV